MFALRHLGHAPRGGSSLARDRLGIKPLYYARPRDGGSRSRSELKALLAAPGVARDDRPATRSTRSSHYDVRPRAADDLRGHAQAAARPRADLGRTAGVASSATGDLRSTAERERGDEARRAAPRSSERACATRSVRTCRRRARRRASSPAASTRRCSRRSPARVERAACRRSRSASRSALRRARRRARRRRALSTPTTTSWSCARTPSSSCPQLVGRVRRAVRRPSAHPDLPRLPARRAAGQGGALGRRRRRASSPATTRTPPTASAPRFGRLARRCGRRSSALPA